MGGGEEGAATVEEPLVRSGTAAAHHDAITLEPWTGGRAADGVRRRPPTTTDAARLSSAELVLSADSPFSGTATGAI